ncbi:MAG: TonB-dependent receptor [bacterium]
MKTMPKSFKRILALAAVFLIIGGAGFAQAEDEAIDLGQIIVTATKTEKEIKNVASSVEVITREEIEASAADNIDDLIGQYAGVYAERENGFLDWKGGLNLRGLDTGDGHTLVLVDGMLLNDGDSGSANFNTINMDNVERVEIVRGPGSTLYGADAMGGVINIITRKPSRELTGKMSVSGGALGTQRQKFDVSGGSDRLGLLFSASNMRSGGFNPSIPANQVAGAEDTTVTEKNYYLKAVSHVGGADSTISFSGMLYDDERHQGQVERPDVNPHGNQLSFDTRRFQLGYSNPGQKFSARTSAFYNLENYERYWDKNAGSNKYNSKKVDSDRLDYGADADVTWKMDRHEVTAGVSWSVADLDAIDDYFYTGNAPTVDPDDDGTNGGKMKSVSAYLHDIAYLSDNIDVEMGLRFNSSKLEGVWYATSSTNVQMLDGGDWDDLNPRIAFNIHTGANTKVRVGYGKAFHAPLLEHLTLTMVRKRRGAVRGEPGPRTRGNRHLRNRVRPHRQTLFHGTDLLLQRRGRLRGLHGPERGP